MPKYIAHIGPHKTGSTYLQASFQQWTPQLRERGILYPQQWLDERAPGHLHLYARLRAGGDSELEREFAELNSSEYRLILLSSEDLARLPADGIAHLKSLLGDSSVTIVFYCRRWSEILPSGWKEQIKQGSVLAFPEFMAAHLANPFASNMINYSNVLDRYADAFGKESISIVSYNSVIERQGNLAAHFFKTFLKWPNSPLTDNSYLNVSLQDVDIELIRIMNVFERMRCGKCGPDIRVRYLKKKGNLDLAALGAVMEADSGVLNLNEDNPALRRLHEIIYEKYGDRLVPPRPPRHFFVPRRAQIRYIQQNYLVGPGVSDVLTGLYAQL